MSTEPTPISDEDLSAALDGEASDELTARIAAEPAATARSAELERAAARVQAASIPPLPAETIDELVLGALDAPIAPAAPRHARRTRGPAPWLVAACIALLVAVGLGLVWSGRSADTADTASTADAGSSADSLQSAEFSDEEAEAFSGASTTTVPIPSHVSGGTTSESTTDSGDGTDPQTDTSRSTDAVPVPLGSFTSGDDLRTALAADFPDAATAAPTDGAETEPEAALLDRCAEQLQVTLNLEDPPRNQGYATVDGQPVLVYEFDSTSFADGSATTLVAAVGEEACEQVVLFER